MDKAFLETLRANAKRAAERASGYRMAGERGKAMQWRLIARCASETADALQVALRLEESK